MMPLASPLPPDSPPPSCSCSRSRWLARAGALLRESPHAAIRAVGERMSARAGAA